MKRQRQQWADVWTDEDIPTSEDWAAAVLLVVLLIVLAVVW